MGIGESKEEAKGVWEELKESSIDYKAITQKLFPICLDWNRFIENITSEQIREHFVTSQSRFLSLTSFVRVIGI